MCTMTGHKSIVSCLAVSNGILYSGSWDGTVRLWSLNDHTPLAVLEDERPNALSPVRCLAVDGNLLLVAQENGYVMVVYNFYKDYCFVSFELEISIKSFMLNVEISITFFVCYK